ncbi:MAG: NTP transferase domain-containing protein [Winogradskyella sp.]|uniref:nucleotidyltransferase family protein n=1 Tax=Winogradskyella sp. TaxID=1883156 RepID=UPI0038587978
MKIALLILAAGRSTRMKTAKQLLPVGTTTLLGSTIENALQSNTQAIYCVLGAYAETVEASISKYKVEIIFNPNYKSGLSSSIAAGIEYLNHKQFDATLIILGDQPYVNARYLNQMMATFKNNPDKIIATNYKTNLGVPALIPKVYYTDLLNLEGDSGAKTFLNSKTNNIIQLNNANVLDIDTKKEYQEYIDSVKFE